jgi:hypothetical protein
MVAEKNKQHHDAQQQKHLTMASVKLGFQFVADASNVAFWDNKGCFQ